MENKHMVRWTNEERNLLAHFVRIAVDENKLSLQEGIEFAAKKLGRSKAACAWQYQNFAKYMYTSTANTVFKESAIENNTEDLLATIKELNSKLKNLESFQAEIVEFVNYWLDQYSTAAIRTIAYAGSITPEDIRYNNNLIMRMIAHKVEQLNDKNA
jgi:hypothetical protein